MTRADLRAMLLLMGFAPSSTGDNNYLLKVDPLRSYGCIRVMAYPRWIIGVHTIEGTKSFFSAKKAFAYITTLLEDTEVEKP